MTIEETFYSAIIDRCNQLQSEGYKGDPESLARELSEIIKTTIEGQPHSIPLTATMIASWLTQVEIILSIKQMLALIMKSPVADGSVAQLLSAHANVF